MRSVSIKQRDINKRIRKAYNEIALERGHYCTGCGRAEGDVPLSHSHLIPRSRCGRTHLVWDKRNITYHCLSMGDRKGCHEIWESIERDKLLDYHKNLEYILEVDTEYYFLITDA